MGPLAGRRLLVTRGKAQASRLAELLVERGAHVVEVPAIEITLPPDVGPLDEALAGLPGYDWVVFTSANAVSAVLGRMVVRGLPPRLASPLRGRPGGPRIASVGRATTAALRASFPEDRVGLEPVADFSAAGLLAAFEAHGIGGRRVLVPASTRARDELAAGLRARGASVDVVDAYDTVEPAGLADAVGRAVEVGFDLALFASPSAVEAFARAAGVRAAGLPAVVIGPTTEAAARGAGMEVREVASPSTAEGLVAAAERAIGGSGRAGGN
jgi:uroporphyrinogen-III synthase